MHDIGDLQPAWGKQLHRSGRRLRVRPVTRVTGEIPPATASSASCRNAAFRSSCCCCAVPGRSTWACVNSRRELAEASCSCRLALEAPLQHTSAPGRCPTFWCKEHSWPAQAAAPHTLTAHLGPRCRLGGGLGGGRRQHGGHCSQPCSGTVASTHLQQPRQQLRLLQQALQHDVLPHAAEHSPVCETLAPMLSETSVHTLATG